MDSDIMNFRYRFSFSGEDTLEFSVSLDKTDLSLRSTVPENDLPEWTRLEFHKCANCPLEKGERLHCPVAKEYYGVLVFFADRASTERVRVTIKTGDRFYNKETDLQTAIATMMGIVNATCGCPVLSQLRPMVLLHVPFATAEETAIRMLSLFLLTGFFEHKKGSGAQPPGLDGKMKLLEDVETVNKGLAVRIRSMSSEDANVNALLRLDAFAKIMKDCIETGFEELDPLFMASFRRVP